MEVIQLILGTFAIFILIYLADLVSQIIAARKAVADRKLKRRIARQVDRKLQRIADKELEQLINN